MYYKRNYYCKNEIGKTILERQDWICSLYTEHSKFINKKEKM